jgi:hypothetical protein
MSNFPSSLDSYSDPSATSKLNSPSHSQQHINANDAIEKIEAKVGANSSVVTTTHDYKLSGVTGTDKASSLEGTETLKNKSLDDGTVIKEATMTLGSDADGDTYYRTSNKLTRLAKGTGLQQLRMNTGATAPEWFTPSTVVVNHYFSWYLDGTSIVADEVGAKYIVPNNMTVTGIHHKTVSGAATIRLQANTTDIDASISVTSTYAEETSITSTALTAGQILTLDITAASSCVGLTVILEVTEP